MVSANLITSDFNTDFLLLQAILSVRVQEATSYMFSLMYSIVSPRTKSSAFPIRDVLIFQLSDTSIVSEYLFKTKYSGYFFFLFPRTNSIYTEVPHTLNTFFLFKWDLFRCLIFKIAF